MNTHQLDLLQLIRQKLDAIEIHNPKLAQFLCRVIPASCPFERDIRLFGHLIAHIPPLCKLNPLYKHLAELRFRALCYLASTKHKHLTGDNGARRQAELAL
jgi:hypothetical protein